MTGGSEGKKEYQVNVLPVEFCFDGGHRLLQEFSEFRNRAHHGNRFRSQMAYGSLRFELHQPVPGKGDIEIFKRPTPDGCLVGDDQVL